MSYNGEFQSPPAPPFPPYGIPPPPPSSDLPPLPHGPPPQTGMYAFGGSSTPTIDGAYNQPRESYRVPEFSFRSNEAPSFPQKYDSYRPYQPMPNSVPERGGYPTRTRHQPPAAIVRDVRKPNGRYGQRRGNRPLHPTSERPLLQFQRGTTPEQMAGMNGDVTRPKRFMAAEDMSDSGEEDMDESDLEMTQILPYSTAEDPPAVEMQANQTRPAALQDFSAASEVSKPLANTPTWSNPDPYTALPPPDESQRKKRDVIKLIRKARVGATLDEGKISKVAIDDDFISFGFEDAKDDKGSNYESASFGEGVPGAPSGPSALNKSNGPSAYSAPPGTYKVPISAGAMGPPPGMQQDSVGERKRKRSPELYVSNDLPRPPKRPKGPGPVSNGSILLEWLATPTGNPIPWQIRSHKLTEQTGFRLHKEICDFYEFVKPQRFEQIVREDLLRRLSNVIKDIRPDCELACFGSFAAGLYLPNADMDLVVNSVGYLRGGYKDAFQSSTEMYQLGRLLKSIAVAEPDSIEVIPKARVPLIKFVDRVTSLKIDLSFENNSGTEANGTFQEWKAAFPAMPIIVTLIKQFLMMRGLSDVANGGLGGFSVTCLVTSLLQNMPRIHTGALIPEQHLGEILLEFLDLYGNQLDISRTAISMRPPGYVEKQSIGYGKNANKFGKLAIVDPNNPDNDISGGSRNIPLILERFSWAHEEILRAMKSPNRASLLDWMLGGNYNTFLWQRNRLRKIYEAKWGCLEPKDPGIQTFALPQTVESNRRSPGLSRDKEVYHHDPDFTRIREPSSIDSSEAASTDSENLELITDIAVRKGKYNRPPKVTKYKKPGKVQKKVTKVQKKTSTSKPGISKPSKRDVSPEVADGTKRPKKGKGKKNDAEKKRMVEKRLIARESYANNFKKSNPQIQNVPARLTKGQAKDILAKYREQHSTKPINPKQPKMMNQAQRRKARLGVSTEHPISIE